MMNDKHKAFSFNSSFIIRVHHFFICQFLQNDIERADDRHHVGDQVADAHLAKRLQIMRHGGAHARAPGGSNRLYR